MHFEALRLVALREGEIIEVALATKNEREMLIRALAHIHPAHAALFCWSTSCIKPALRTGLLYVFGEEFLTSRN